MLGSKSLLLMGQCSISVLFFSFSPLYIYIFFEFYMYHPSCSAFDCSCIVRGIAKKYITDCLMEMLTRGSDDSLSRGFLNGPHWVIQTAREREDETTARGNFAHVCKFSSMLDIQKRCWGLFERKHRAAFYQQDNSTVYCGWSSIIWRQSREKSAIIRVQHAKAHQQRHTAQRKSLQFHKAR